METTLNGLRAVVTGGTRGIGRAIVEALLDQGCAVTFCGRSAESVAQAAKELHGRNIHACVADVSQYGDVAELFRFAVEKMGGLDILVNNAGLGIFKPTGEMSIEEWQRTIEVNLSGPFYCAHEAIVYMRNAGGGFIVHISSLAGRNPLAGGAAYNASKFGLNGLSGAMMLDHRDDNIRVTTIMPGSVNTEFSSRSAAKGEDWKIAPADIADMVVTVLRMPKRTLVSAVEMRPSKPPKG